MSIASQLDDSATYINSAYAMIAQRGGTVPQRKNLANLATAIATIPSNGEAKED